MHFFVAGTPVRDLLLRAKHLFVAAMMAISPIGGPRMRSSTSSALNSEQDLASIPMAQGGLTRLAIACLKSAGVPVTPLLKRVGLTPELIADLDTSSASASSLAGISSPSVFGGHFDKTWTAWCDHGATGARRA
jgi:hypothetical protein